MIQFMIKLLYIILLSSLIEYFIGCFFFFSQTPYIYVSFVSLLVFLRCIRRTLTAFHLQIVFCAVIAPQKLEVHIS